MKRYFYKDFKRRTVSELTEDEFTLYMMSDMDKEVEIEGYDTEKHTVTFYHTRYPYTCYCILVPHRIHESITRREKGKL